MQLMRSMLSEYRGIELFRSIPLAIFKGMKTEPVSLSKCNWGYSSNSKGPPIVTLEGENGQEELTPAFFSNVIPIPSSMSVATLVTGV